VDTRRPLPEGRAAAIRDTGTTEYAFGVLHRALARDLADTDFEIECAGPDKLK
jgi:hypothetical protein